MELGRECLRLWGYQRCDEIIWVKTNQLQRIIRTGRTGHWLNHGKEHCLVGVKGCLALLYLNADKTGLKLSKASNISSPKCQCKSIRNLGSLYPMLHCTNKDNIYFIITAQLF